MRHKPVTRDEVRFDGQRITTVPADAVHQLEPIPKLWAPLLRQLNEASKNEWEAGTPVREERERIFATVGFGPETWTPITAPRPRWRSERQCRRCGRMFYTAATRLRVSTTRYCSDHCADAVARERRHGKANSRWVQRRSEQSQAARADRKCAVCGAPLNSQRSSKKFCSPRCRMVAHRSDSLHSQG